MLCGGGERQVFGKVGIDSIAGLSEVLVMADGDNNPDWIAIDLLSQAEHDEAAQAILITPDDAFAQAVVDAAEAIPHWRGQMLRAHLGVTMVR